MRRVADRTNHLMITLIAMDTLTLSFNAAITSYLKTSGMSQTDLGRRLSKSQSWISHRLNGVSRWTLEDIAALQSIGVPVGEFLYSQLPMELKND